MATVMATLWQPCFRTVAICTPAHAPCRQLSPCLSLFRFCGMWDVAFCPWGFGEVTGGVVLLAFSPWGGLFFLSVITDQRKVKQNVYFAYFIGVFFLIFSL